MPLNLNEFTKRLTDSELMSAGDLGACVKTLTESPTAAETLDKKLTPFQAQHIWKGKGKSLTLGNYVISDKIGVVVWE